MFVSIKENGLRFDQAFTVFRIFFNTCDPSTYTAQAPIYTGLPPSSGVVVLEAVRHHPPKINKTFSATFLFSLPFQSMTLETYLENTIHTARQSDIN